MDSRRRKQIRLLDYDYSQEDAYFITICTNNRICHFGEIKNDKMLLNSTGKAADYYWQEIPAHYPRAVLDEYTVMPNHIHGIIIIDKDHDTSVNREFPTQSAQPDDSINRFQHIIPKSIGSIIRGYKLGMTKWVREHTKTNTIWQRSYYDHIIRDEKAMDEIRAYIINNPGNWDNDRNNLKNYHPTVGAQDSVPWC